MSGELEIAIKAESPPKDVVLKLGSPRNDASMSPSNKNTYVTEAAAHATTQAKDGAGSRRRSSLQLASTSALPHSDKTVPFVPKVEPGSSSDDAQVPIKKEIKNEIKNEIHDSDQKEFGDDDNGKVGFGRGLVPDHIIGATEQEGKLMFLVAWQGSQCADLIVSTEIYEKYPQVAIAFFEARLRYCRNV